MADWIRDGRRPVLPRHAKLRFDKTREQWVLLVPERVLAPDDTAVEILQLCDGKASVAEIVDHLAAKYSAEPELIQSDVVAMLEELAEKRFLVLEEEET